MGGDMLHDAIRADLWAWATSETRAKRDTAAKETTEHVERFRKTLDELEQQPLDAATKQSLAEERKVIEGYLGAAERVVKSDKMLNQVPPEFEAEFLKVEKQMETVTESLNANTKRAKENGDATVVRASRTRLAILGISIVVVCLSTVWLRGAIIRPIQAMSDCARAIARGNLAVDDLTLSTEDEVGILTSSINQMKKELATLIRSIATSAERIASSTEEVSTSANLQAQGAETQKDQAVQVATAMQEMISTVAQVSENSGKAAQTSRRAAETARHGGTIVQETLSKMRAISDSVSNTSKKVEELGKSSEKIGHIAAVIDDIADLTNLLALNAAIEAARAGEQGRGFAVVADEVRKLAERTASATKEIADMVSTIREETRSAVLAMQDGTRQVDEGVNSTSQAGEALKEIIHTSEQVGDMVNQIATAAAEQSSTSEEVNHNMERIAKLVNESAEGARQSAQACRDLSDLALDLQKMVGTFQVGGKEEPIERLHQKRPGLKASAALA
jgi:methyl-accepting chemotaxis protein